MTYIHKRPGWPKLFWKTDALTTALGQVRYMQGKHLGQMEALGFELRAEAGLVALTEEVVKSSAIEGENLNPAEVRSSIARRLGLDAGGLPEPGRMVEGVVEMMLDATRNFETPLTQDRLFGWHTTLFPTGRSGIYRIPVGAWRNGEAEPMRVISGPIGKERVHFEAPAAGRVSGEIETFLEWFNGPSDTDPVLEAGVAHVWFITIHPFADGNGRIARAITEMALARADRRADRFYSMSSGIEAERREYYRQLESAQRGSLDITDWLAWFLGCLDRTLNLANKAHGSVLHQGRFWQRINRSPINERQRKVIHRLLQDFRGYLTTSKYAKLARCSNDTALRDIKELLENGILIRNPGGGRSTSYRLMDIAENSV